MQENKPTWIWCFMFMGVTLISLIIGAIYGVDMVDMGIGATTSLFLWGIGTIVIGIIKGLYNSALERKNKETEGAPPIAIVLFGTMISVAGAWLMFRLGIIT